MQHYSQHRHEGSWQKHLFLGPQAAGLLKTGYWRTNSEKIDCFPHSLGSPKGLLTVLHMLPRGIQYGCLPLNGHHFLSHYRVVHFHISPPQERFPHFLWKAGLPPPCTRSNRGGVFSFCLLLFSSGAMETGWMSSLMTTYPRTTTSWSSPSPLSATSSGVPSWKRPMQSKATDQTMPGSLPRRTCATAYRT